MFIFFRSFFSALIVLAVVSLAALGHTSTWAQQPAAAAVARAPADWWTDLINDRDTDIRRWLRRGVSPNAVDPEGLPSLMLAIREEAWKSYAVLVAHRDTDLNAINPHDETPLMYLAVIGQTDKARQLIGKGAQVNRLGWTPLHYAASRGHADTVRLLLQHQAIVNAPGTDGTTPLMMAAYAGSEEVVRILLAAGADVTMHNTDNLTAVEWAQRAKYHRLADKLADLVTRVQNRRASFRQAQTADPATAATSDAMIDLTLDAAPSSESAAADSQQPAPSKEDTSRYFDLDRFDREDDPYAF